MWAIIWHIVLNQIQTCPPEVLINDPALIEWPVLIEQWAADRTVQASKTVPPQNWKFPLRSATCHGIMLGATSPPTILSPPMKDGMSATKKTKKWKLIFVRKFSRNIYIPQVLCLGSCFCAATNAVKHKVRIAYVIFWRIKMSMMMFEFWNLLYRYIPFFPPSL